jgi:glycine cleavage system transcriptional repressor
VSDYALLTANGPDRPGLVNDISRFILDCGCNIEDSRMAVLGSSFAMLILVNGEKSGIERLLEGAAAAGEKAGLTVTAERSQPPGRGREEGVVPYEIGVYSMDHPGIVEHISRFLAERRINVRALDTRLTHAPITGLPLFSLHATIDVPSTEKIIEVRQGLEAIGLQENLDVEIKPAKT